MLVISLKLSAILCLYLGQLSLHICLVTLAVYRIVFSVHK
jgi:hypothetical protein